MAANVTIEIDANAAKYLAAATRMANETKKVTKEASKTGKEMEGWKNQLGQALPILDKVSRGMGLASIAAAAMAAQAKTFADELERGNKVRKSLASDLPKVVQGAFGIDALPSVQQGIGPSLSSGAITPGQAAGLLGAATSAAPTLTPDQGVSVVNASAKATQAQLPDPQMFARAMAVAVANGVDPGAAADMAFALIQQSGGKAQEAVDAFARLAPRVGASNAVPLARTVIAAAQSRQGTEALLTATSKFRGGDFAAFITSHAAVSGAEATQKPAIRAIQGAYGGISIAGGALDRGVQAALSNPAVFNEERIRTGRNRRDFSRFEEHAGKLSFLDHANEVIAERYGIENGILDEGGGISLTNAGLTAGTLAFRAAASSAKQPLRLMNPAEVNPVERAKIMAEGPAEVIGLLRDIVSNTMPVDRPQIGADGEGGP